jgi:hypothetical protein
MTSGRSVLLYSVGPNSLIEEVRSEKELKKE